jgi:ABC-type transport system involved in Fe-S cluster assembly fused permease/ATPase subunit
MIEKLQRFRTRLFIANCSSTIVSADRIIVMPHVQLAEVGTYDDLPQQGVIHSR